MTIRPLPSRMFRPERSLPAETALQPFPFDFDAFQINFDGRGGIAIKIDVVPIKSDALEHNKFMIVVPSVRCLFGEINY
jgi:hypothetical protein